MKKVKTPLAQQIGDELKLDANKRAALSVILRTEGFDILQALIEDEIVRFNVQLMNIPNSDHAAVIAAHGKAQALAQWYSGLMGRIASELQIHANTGNNDPVNEIGIEEFR